MTIDLSFKRLKEMVGAGVPSVPATGSETAAIRVLIGCELSGAVRGGRLQRAASMPGRAIFCRLWIAVTST